MTTARFAPSILLAGALILPLIGPGFAAAAEMDQGQARSKMEAAGYTDVSEVHEGNLGEWMAQAVRGGQTVLIVLHRDGTVGLRQNEQVPPAKSIPNLQSLAPNKP